MKMQVYVAEAAAKKPSAAAVKKAQATLKKADKAESKAAAGELKQINAEARALIKKVNSAIAEVNKAARKGHAEILRATSPAIKSVLKQYKALEVKGVEFDTGAQIELEDLLGSKAQADL